MISANRQFQPKFLQKTTGNDFGITGKLGRNNRENLCAHFEYQLGVPATLIVRTPQLFVRSASRQRAYFAEPCYAFTTSLRAIRAPVWFVAALVPMTAS